MFLCLLFDDIEQPICVLLASTANHDNVLFRLFCLSALVVFS